MAAPGSTNQGGVPADLLSVSIPVQYQIKDVKAYAYNHVDAGQLLVEAVGPLPVVPWASLHVVAEDAVGVPQRPVGVEVPAIRIQEAARSSGGPGDHDVGSQVGKLDLGFLLDK